jgi:hypothetical protein
VYTGTGTGTYTLTLTLTHSHAHTRTALYESSGDRNRYLGAKDSDYYSLFLQL